MGFFTRQYETAGPGIAKNAPPKKPIVRFFQLFGRKFWKLLELNLIYFLMCLPLVGAVILVLMGINGQLTPSAAYPLAGVCALLFAVLFGPATAAHIKILRNFVTERPCFLWHEFLTTMKREFAHAAAVGLLDILIFVSIASSFYVYPKMIEQSGQKAYYALFAVTISVGLLVLMMNFYVFLMMVSTNLSLKNIFKNALALAVVALKNNIITLLILAACTAVYALVFIFAELRISMILIFLLPFIPASWLTLIVVFRCYPIIQKYIINPYYEQQGKVNPELRMGAEHDENVLFEDMGGRETPIAAPGKEKKAKGSTSAKSHKGRIIS